jgi:hypothetical protein
MLADECYQRDGNFVTGICYYLFRSTDYKITQFPELIVHKPTFENKVRHPYAFLGYWFPLTVEGTARRIQIIEEAISKTD